MELHVAAAIQQQHTLGDEQQAAGLLLSRSSNIHQTAEHKRRYYDVTAVGSEHQACGDEPSRCGCAEWQHPLQSSVSEAAVLFIVARMRLSRRRRRVASHSAAVEQQKLTEPRYCRPQASILAKWPSES